MNSINPLKYASSEVAFYAWECLTLQLKHRDLNLVIKDEKDMERLLKFLIYQLNTIDGKKDSSLGLQQKLAKSNEPLLKLKHQLMLKTMTKYKILSVRNKLSF
jgi:hypothetical protein